MTYMSMLVRYLLEGVFARVCAIYANSQHGPKICRHEYAWTIMRLEHPRSSELMQENMICGGLCIID